jgi:hypothetical protein
MSDAEFFAGLTGGQNDFARAVAALRATRRDFCLIGGLAINHYVEPVVTLDADFAVAASGGVALALRNAGFLVEEFPHSLKALFPGSRLRFQLTINDRDGDFPSRAVETELFGVRVPVAALEDLVQGKLWAAQDATRRDSKRQKDRLDLTRICESHARMIPLIPPGLIPEVDQLRKLS